MTIDRAVMDSSGDKLFVAWVEDSYFPATYLVAGDNMADAHDWFLCCESVEKDIKIDAEYAKDYVEGGGKEGVWETAMKNALAVATEEGRADNNTYVTWLAFEMCMKDGKASSYAEYNDNGVLVDTEAVHMVTLKQWLHRQMSQTMVDLLIPVVEAAAAVATPHTMHAIQSFVNALIVTRGGES